MQAMAGKRPQKLEVKVPDAAADRLPLLRVGIIAGLGFLAGVLWPALAGVKLVPTAPSEDGRPAAEEVAAEAAPEGDTTPAAAKVVPAGEDKEPEPVRPEDRVQVGPPIFINCLSKDAKKLDRCDEIDADSVLKARIQSLANCGGAEGASGTLSLGFKLHFGKNKVEKIMRGKSTTLPDDVTAVLLTCAEKEFKSVALDGVQHEHVEYTVFYKAEFFPPGSAPSSPDAGPPVTAASGLATVSWNVALVREAPVEGKVVARVLSGTKVKVTGRRDDWYRITYDAKGGEGWVHKGALGL